MTETLDGLFPAPQLARVGAGAILDGPYRYVLTRRWNPDLPEVVWCMLNPSTADATEDDPTIRRCMGFARSWGYGGIAVVNLFGWRSTDPDALPDPATATGPDNDGYLTAIATAAHANGGVIVVAWGAHGDRYPDRVAAAYDALTLGGRIPTLALAVTKLGQPRHPLYVHSETQAAPWEPPRGP